MLLVLIGLVLVALKATAIGPFAECPWWLAIAPLALAVLWWKFSDATGLDKRREMKRMEARKAERRRDALTATGQSPEAEKALAARQREIDRVEGRRAKIRKQNRDSLLGSRFNSEQPEVTRPGEKSQD
ncbi:TIGR04438 family Trp-rich protein [Rhizobacter fulvus]